MAEKEVTPEGARRSTRQTVMTEKNMQEELKRFEEEIKKLFKQPIAETHQDELIKTSKSLKSYLAQYQTRPQIRDLIAASRPLKLGTYVATPKRTQILLGLCYIILVIHNVLTLTVLT